MLCVGPKDGPDSAGHLECPVDWQPLQRLNVKSPIVELAFGVFFPMNTLSLSKHLFLHSNALLSRAASRKQIFNKCRGFRSGESYYGANHLLVVTIPFHLSEMMPLH
jgi:hypothetical protein